MKINEIWKDKNTQRYFVVADMYYSNNEHQMGYHRVLVNPPKIGERALVTSGYGACLVKNFVKSANKVCGMIIRYDGSTAEECNLGTIEKE